jgi:hypothetical protein
MHTQPPENFDTADFCKSFYSFQQWDLFPGHVVPGAKDVTSHMRHLRIPERLDGSRVSGIAPWNGFFGFECLPRGAAEVVSLVAGRVMHQLPMVYFTKGEETRDAYNWFLPNKRALMNFVESSGFMIDTGEDDGGNWASVDSQRRRVAIFCIERSIS